MAATEWKAITWSPNEPITDDMLNGMVNNTQYVRDRMTMARYAANGVTRDTGIRIACGLALITARSTPGALVGVSFPSGYFSSACKPIVVCSLISPAYTRIFTRINGRGSALMPDSTGMELAAWSDADNAKDRKIPSNIYLSWIAIGW